MEIKVSLYIELKLQRLLDAITQEQRRRGEFEWTLEQLAEEIFEKGVEDWDRASDPDLVR